MENNNEKVADVVKEMRYRVETNERAGIHPNNCRLYTDWANRIEAAHKREVAKLRESLSDAIELFCDTCTDNDEETGRCKDKDGVCPCVARWRNALKEGDK